MENAIDLDNLTPLQLTIRTLSERIVKAQKPIRILDAIKWDQSVQTAFFAKDCRELPKINAQYYAANPLSYDLGQLTAEFYAIERDIHKCLGQFSGVGNIMLRICREYRTTLNLLAARGTPEFGRIALELYGSADDAFYTGAPSLKDLAEMLRQPLTHLIREVSTQADEKCFNSQQAVELLTDRLAFYFQDANKVKVMLSDNIVADAAAGADCLKINKDSLFSERDLRLLEVHEGWVHIATTFNGAAQPICTFLSKGAPSSTITQEGLAVITEIFTFSCNPIRVQRIIDRISGIHMAEQGANFLEVFNHFCEQGNSKEDSYKIAMRIFRGSAPELGPFPKDLAYGKGFILIYNYIRLAIQQGLLRNIPTLFVGKTTIEDLQTLTELMAEGLVIPPVYVPPQFSDLAALSSWMCFSLFMNKLDLGQLSLNYKGILHA